MRRSLRVPLVVATAAVALLVVGIVVFVTNRYDLPGGDVAVGYAGYQPLDALSAPGSGGGVLWSGTAVVGLGVAVVGLVLLAGVGGLLLGRTRRGDPPTQ